MRRVSTWLGLAVSVVGVSFVVGAMLQGVYAASRQSYDPPSAAAERCEAAGVHDDPVGSEPWYPCVHEKTDDSPFEAALSRMPVVGIGLLLTTTGIGVIVGVDRNPGSQR